MALDQYEKEILDSYEKGHLKTRVPSKQEILKVAQIAHATMKKNRRITVRLYEHDYLGIQKKALELGLPYQTLISSLVHRFVDGELVER